MWMVLCMMVGPSLRMMMWCVVCAVQGEADGFLHSIRWAKQNNVSTLIIERDCADVLNCIAKPRDDVTVTRFLTTCMQVLRG